MTIQKINYNWNGSLTKRKITTEAIIHHMAGEGSVLDIHRIHLNNGWVGIGYHFYVRLDGTIYEGRPINMIGAHTTGRNSSAIGICFEGNYETRISMPPAQLKAGRELIAHIRKLYPNITFAKHKDYNATACPGKNFPYASLIDENVVEDIPMKEEIYNWIPSCPEWSQPYIQKAWDLGWIKGDGNENLNLNDEKIFTLVVMLRALNIME